VLWPLGYGGFWFELDFDLDVVAGRVDYWGEWAMGLRIAG